VTAAGWLLIVAALVFAAAGYRYSLSRNPTRACHLCGGGGKHKGWVWRYAAGECKGRTVLPPRTRCDKGRVPRWGARVLRIEDKGK
jgi:hypothetical protein